MSAKTNAIRQAEWRARQREGQRLVAVGAFGLTGFDESLLTRLFGPKLVLEDASIALLVAESFDQARRVESREPLSGPHLVDALVREVVVYGLGAIPAGWSIRANEAFVCLEVWRLKSGD